MARDKVVGSGLLAGAVIGVIIYFSLLFVLGDMVALIVLKITAFVAVFAVLAILGWIGYVMATTPPPIPLEPEASLTAPTTSGEKTKEGSDSTPEKKS